MVTHHQIMDQWRNGDTYTYKQYLKNNIVYESKIQHSSVSLIYTVNMNAVGEMSDEVTGEDRMSVAASTASPPLCTCSMSCVHGRDFKNKNY